VQRLRAGGAKAASLHLRYIERDGVEKDGTKGVLYGRDLGRKLEWAAVNHHDTGHPHAHVVIRGVGLDGQEVRFDRAYIAKGLRWRAQELATEELGPRHEREVARARRREVTQERFTSLDREIERCASDQRVTRAALAASRRIDPSALLARLEQLERFGLAERASRTEWVLAPDWTQQLRELGTRGDILHAIHQALRGDPARYRIVAPGQALRDVDGTDGPLVGRVVQKGLADESKGTFYAIVETPAGVAYRLPLAASMAEDLRAGDLVSFDTRRESAVRAVDRRIAEVARDQGGLVVEPETGAEVEKVRQRLVELERLGLVRAERDARRRTLHGTRSGFERSSR
jgi:type IV secretory pathway VirD2 relaxase